MVVKMLPMFLNERTITNDSAIGIIQRKSPLRIPAGGAAAAGASSACRPRAAPLSALKTATALCPAVRCLRRSASLHSPHPLPSGHR